MKNQIYIYLNFHYFFVVFKFLVKILILLTAEHPKMIINIKAVLQFYYV